MAGVFQPDRAHITTPQAQHLSGLSRTYLARLLRQGVLEGFQLGREWIIYQDSLDRFLTTPRKPGPKGPRKNLASKSLNVSSMQGKERNREQ